MLDDKTNILSKSKFLGKKRLKGTEEGRTGMHIQSGRLTHNLPKMPIRECQCKVCRSETLKKFREYLVPNTRLRQTVQ